jgi:undecaprenyl-diphosphooligosaccharide--protein glycosyltransferase
MDAGYFLGIAQSLSRQNTTNDFFARRSFPDGKKYTKNVSNITPAKPPLLSRMIHWLADNDSPQA